ncbi:hypothetical protein PN499_10985 [Kamptonema animale CS-326]|jgi:hypothetical protein|uniref:hypothetical protein n=1 Tax=Kamptonema TaxID=1501433 RepID=UPI0001DAC14D|nr:MULTISPECIES: hypothetical protein [Kamptonema]MDB9511709.1 hypothetical protein [Kamptonema animale CS-326]CBN56643.1 hypothetical protein OSCI_3100016 [Kamptonema sp. PCC 6506]
MNSDSDNLEGKRCQLVAEVPGPPDTNYKYCVYKCKDWRGGLIARPLKKEYDCPKEIDWWDSNEIPGAIPENE